VGIFALLVSLAIVGLVIVGFITYWLVMITLFVIAAVFIFWAVIFGLLFGDPYVGSLCSVFATGVTFWLFNSRVDKSD
jgi:hypothetical protein